MTRNPNAKIIQCKIGDLVKIKVDGVSTDRNSTIGKIVYVDTTFVGRFLINIKESTSFTRNIEGYIGKREGYNNIIDFEKPIFYVINVNFDIIEIIEQNKQLELF